MPRNLYEHDYTNNGIRLVLDTGYGPTVPLEDLTNGRYSLSGRILRDTSNGQIVTNLSSRYLSRFEVLEDGRLYVLKGIEPGAINEATRLGGMNAISGNIEVQSSAGVLRTLSIDTATVTPINRRVVAVINDRGETVFQTTPAVDERTIDLQRRLNDTWRYATPTEAGQRGVMAYLMEHHRELIDEIIAEGGIDGNTEDGDLASATVKYIAKMGLIDMQGQLVFILDR